MSKTTHILMSSSHPTSLTTKVTRTYTTGLRFEGKDAKERKAHEKQANNIITNLQRQIEEKITEEKVDRSLELIRAQPRLKGIKGAAVLAKEFNDRSNLGQVAYLAMLNAVKGTKDREEKINTFIEHLKEKPMAAIEWLIFGRTPYLEWVLQHQLSIAYDYSRNLIHSARRTADTYLPKEHRLLAPLPSLSRSQIVTAITEFQETILQQFKSEEELSSNQKAFVKKLKLVHKQRLVVSEGLIRWITAWNTGGPDCTSRWNALKVFTCSVEDWLSLEENKKIKKHSYLSVIRGILVHALAPYLNNGAVVKKLIDQDILISEHMVVKPFRKEKKKKKKKNNNNNSNNKHKLIPLSLLMGSKYVVGRPGSSTVMTTLAQTKGSFTISIWPPRHRKKALTATIIFSKKLCQYLANGAKLQLLVLRSSTGPSSKLVADFVFIGQYWMFLSTNFMKNSSLTINSSLSGSPGLGIDINRIGPFILAFSEDIVLPSDLIIIMDRCLHLEKVIASLQRCISRWKSYHNKKSSPFIRRRLSKYSLELSFVYARRKRLLREIHRSCSRLVSLALFQTNCAVLGVESLSLSARGTSGPLAKAILSMPDGLDLFTRAVLLVNHFSDQSVSLRSVNPAYTSSGLHVGCPSSPPGRLSRSSSEYDFAPCPSCGSLVNTHFNAACLIRVRALSSPLPD